MVSMTLIDLYKDCTGIRNSTCVMATEDAVKVVHPGDMKKAQARAPPPRPLIGLHSIRFV